jgi:hypothetical protein
MNGGNIRESGYQGIRVALKVMMPAVFGELIGEFLPEKGGTFSLFLCLIKRLMLVQHEILRKVGSGLKKVLILAVLSRYVR